MSAINNGMVKIIQQQLNKIFALSLAEDGIIGNNTLQAIATIQSVSNNWDQNRQIIGALQFICTRNNIETGIIDGYWGSVTEWAYEQLKVKIATGHPPKPWRDDEGIGAIPDRTAKWPLQTQDELFKFYGDVGINQVKVDCPYPLRIEWAPEKVINRFSCHEKVADSIYNALNNTLQYYGHDRIQQLGLDLWSGCLNVRKMRGGTKYSTHSWGISIDFYAARNKLRWGKDKAAFAKADYDKWWEFWENEGATSLGRTRNYDWMHIQFCNVKK